jgi:uncharacterized protein (TIGR00266 family)
MHHQLAGDDMQAVILALQLGESVRADAGAMLYMTDGIEMNTQLGTGKEQGMLGGLMSGLKRVVTGESLFITTFTAERQPGQVAFSAPYPGKIIPLNLSETGEMLCQRDSYLCSDTNVDIQVAFTRRFGAGLFGGEGFILQKLTGTGTAFIHAGGTILPIDLEAGQSLRVDTGCLVGMSAGVTYDIQMVKGIKTMLFGGEGLFYAYLTGPGKVFLQTLPFNRLADRIVASARVGGTEESTGLAGMGGKLLGGMISGD